MNNKMGKILVLICLVGPSIIFAEDVVVLKNGQEIIGKVLSQNNKSVVIDSGEGVGITFYSDEIISVNQKPIGSSENKNPFQSIIEQTAVMPQEAGSPLTEDEKKQLAQNILYLKNQSFKSITCHLSYGSFEKYDQSMQQVMKMMGDIYTIKINWQEYKITFDNSGNASFTHPSIVLGINPTVKEKLEQTQPDFRSQMEKLSESFKEKMKGNLKEIDDGTIKIMEIIAGAKGGNKLTSPLKLLNGQITDSGSLNVGQAMAAITGTNSVESTQAGMDVFIRYLYEPKGEKFIIREVDMNIKMPQVMDMRMRYKIDYQHLEAILFPEKISLAMEMVSQNSNTGLTQNQQEEITFNQCNVQ